MLLALTEVATTGLFTLGGTALGASLGWLAAGSERRHQSTEASRQREHDERAARAERLHRMRETAYVDLSAEFERMRAFVSRAMPITTGAGAESDPGTFPGSDWQAMSGRVSVTATQAVLDAFGAVSDAGTEFVGRVSTLRAVLAQHGPGHEQTIEARRELDAARTRVNERIDDAERVMRVELAAL
jgi:hypothetical protein